MNSDRPYSSKPCAEQLQVDRDGTGAAPASGTAPSPPNFGNITQQKYFFFSVFTF